MTPAFLKWMTDFTNLIGSVTDETSESSTSQKTAAPKKMKRSRTPKADVNLSDVPKKKKSSGKPSDDVFLPLAKKEKSSIKRTK